MSSDVQDLRRRGRSVVRSSAIIAGILVLASQVPAAQVDIAGPPGSVAFGTFVSVLPNGNIVVIDPSGPVSNIGAVYLYSPSGSLISTLTGSSSNDHVGSRGVRVVGNGNFVVLSPVWNNGAATLAGAVTWVNGTTGLSGVVSNVNSLIGTTQNDQVGFSGVTVLSNGNYVVASPFWSSNFGAATWGNGNSGVSGAVSSANSLVGSTSKDQISAGSVAALSNGNYVVASPGWNNGTPNTFVGAATWGNGASGTFGVVSTVNSLFGMTTADNVGSKGVTALSNGNYVVASPSWSGLGAATWGSGTSGVAGAISASNSLIGSISIDAVSGGGVFALNNGNYVVASPRWNNGVANNHVGAATWANGATGLSGVVSASNSLIGTTVQDNVGNNGVTALSNGNYVVGSPNWGNGGASQAGAATWGNGNTGTSGPLTVGNSLVGTTLGDFVGIAVTALSNGNYVVQSDSWGNGVVGARVGAATWGNGSSGVAGAVSASNSLIGTTDNDRVGGNVAALSNGNYVVGSSDWNNGVANGFFGAATWASGTTGITGPVTAGNSLIGTTINDGVGAFVLALNNGNYLVQSFPWSHGATPAVGALTWGNGGTGLVGSVAASNSLIGTSANDKVGLGGQALGNNSYIVFSANWSNGAAMMAGAVTMASDRFRVKGTIQPWNSVLGTTANGGAGMVFSYDAPRGRLIVGRPSDNVVSVFTPDQIFAGDFDP